MSIFQKRGKRGKRYYIDYYVDGKRVRECVGDVPRKVAEDILKVRQAEIVQESILAGHQPTRRLYHGDQSKRWQNAINSHQPGFAKGSS